MLHLKSVMRIGVAGFLAVILAGCYKDKTVIFETGEEITRPVSFVQDLVPIFNTACNGSGCHSTGGIAPDLTAANAYNALAGGNYFSITNPLNSELYLWMTGKKAAPMPLSGPNKDYNALILAWIKQGAQNN